MSNPTRSGLRGGKHDQAGRSRRLVPLLATMALTASVMAGPTTAMAETIQISAAGFTPAFPTSGASFNIRQGILVPGDENGYVAAAPLSGRGRVCEFSLTFSKFTAKPGRVTLEASLLRRPAAAGGLASDLATRMATVIPGPYSVETVRKATTKDISFAAIDSSKYYYFVELSASSAAHVIGVQIETCE